MITSAAFLYLL